MTTTNLTKKRVEHSVFGFIREIEEKSNLAYNVPVYLKKACIQWYHNPDIEHFQDTKTTKAIRFLEGNIKITSKASTKNDIFNMNIYGVQEIGSERNKEYDFDYTFDIQRLARIRIGITTEKVIQCNQTSKYCGIEIQGQKAGSDCPILYHHRGDRKYYPILGYDTEYSPPKDEIKFIKMSIKDDKVQFKLQNKDRSELVHGCKMERNTVWHMFVNIDRKATVKLEKFEKIKRKQEK